jgi:hypothetical protein
MDLASRGKMEAVRRQKMIMPLPSLAWQGRLIVRQ